MSEALVVVRANTQRSDVSLPGSNGSTWPAPVACKRARSRVETSESDVLTLFANDTFDGTFGNTIAVCHNDLCHSAERRRMNNAHNVFFGHDTTPHSSFV